MSFMDYIAQFHFLRPFWLFALLAVPFLAWYAQKKQVFSGSDWSKSIQPELLKHLMVGQQTSKATQHTRWFALIATLTIAGLAGPSWEKKPQPLHQPSDNLAIVLDLSLSMLATDQKPDRLTRAKHKLRDLLDLRKEGNTALIVYSGDSHVVTPLTDDTNTLKSMLPALDPFIMPAMGSQPAQAMAQAIEVLQNGGANQGRILLITDGVENNDLSAINQLLSATDYPLSVLAIGTEQGGPISIPERGYLKDKGSVIIPKTDFDRLEKLATQNNGRMEPIGLSDGDLKQLGAVISSDFQSDDTSNDKHHQTDDEKANNSGLFDQWHDEGYWFALLLIPVVLISYRRGAFSLLLFLSFTFQSNDTLAFEWKDLWKTPDQQAMELVNKEPAKAAALFQDPQWKASAQYKAQDFEAAQQTFSSDASAQSLYNQANALAQQQKFEEAIATYDKALKADPEFEDAQFNKALIEKFLEEQPPQDQQSSDQQSDEENESEKSDSEKSDSDSSDSKESEGDSSESNSDESENSDSQNSESDPSNNQGEPNEDESQPQEESQPSDAEKEPPDEQSTEQQSQQNSEEQSEQEKAEAQQAQAAEADELTDEETQAFEQWMRRVPDDPGGLLRRKFSQQYQQRGQQRQEGQPIW